MWTRALLKANAKTVLRRSYWRVFLMCLIASLLSGGVNLNFNTSDAQAGYRGASQVFSHLIGGDLLSALLGMAFAMVSALALVLVLAAALCWGILISPVIDVGQCRYMIQNRAGTVSLGTLFSGFTNSYWNTVSGMFYANLRIFLHFLLLIVPGIIKAYAYSMGFFVLADRPDLSANECRKRSMYLMKGHKWQLFCLDFSFIGWYLLSLLTLGILSFWVVPYHMTARAEFYQELLKDEEQRANKAQ